MMRLTMTGRLGRDAELKTLESGAQLINFSLAHTKKSKDNAGNWVESTQWVDCVKWVNQGQSTAVVQYMKKGGQILVEGEPTARAYDSNGEIKSVLGCTVYNIELLGGGTQEGGQQQQQNGGQYQQPQQQQTQAYKPPQQQQQGGGGYANPDDLPF